MVLHTSDNITDDHLRLDHIVINTQTLGGDVSTAQQVHGREAAEEALLRAGHPLTAEPAVVSPTTLGVRGATMAGTAPGALSSIAVAEDLRAGRLVRVLVEGLAIARPLSAIWSGRRPSAAARAFLSMRTLSTS